MKVDIVTGFLGAGKTTFISRYVQYIKKQNEKVLIIENEFGLAGIDKLLLYTKEWNDFSDSDYEKLASVGRTYFAHRAIVEHHVGMVEHLFFAAKIKRKQDIEPLLHALFEMKGAEVIRVKGYIQAADKGLFLVNCTSTCFSIQEHNGKHAVLNVIGANIEERDIKALVQAYE